MHRVALQSAETLQLIAQSTLQRWCLLVENHHVHKSSGQGTQTTTLVKLQNKRKHEYIQVCTATRTIEWGPITIQEQRAPIAPSCITHHALRLRDNGNECLPIEQDDMCSVPSTTEN